MEDAYENMVASLGSVLQWLKLLWKNGSCSFLDTFQE